MLSMYWSPEGLAVLSIAHGLLSLFVGIAGLAGVPKDRPSPFYQQFRFLTGKAHDSAENWAKSRAYNAKRTILWSMPEIVIGIVAYSISLPQVVVFCLFMIVALAATLPGIETILFIRRL